MQTTKPTDTELHRQFQIYMAIDGYFDTHGGDHAALLKDHSTRLSRGGWPTFNSRFPANALNGVSNDELFQLLNSSHTERAAAFAVVMPEKPDGVDLTAEQIHAIRQWFAHFALDKPFFLKKHQEMLAHGGWDNASLNALSVNDLGLALFHGYRLA